MKFTSKTVSNQKGLNSILKKLKTLETHEGTAGFYGKMHPTHGVTDTEIAVKNEWGVPEEKIPSRPFMSTAASQGALKMNRLASKLFGQWLQGKITTKTMLKKLSEEEAEWIKHFIIHNSFEPNSDRTLEGKPGDQPLVNTGWLSENVGTKVRKK